MQNRKPEDIATAARDGPGIDAAMRRAVVKAVEERRKLGLPIVSAEPQRASPDARAERRAQRGAA